MRTTYEIIIFPVTRFATKVTQKYENKENINA